MFPGLVEIPSVQRDYMAFGFSVFEPWGTLEIKPVLVLEGAGDLVSRL